MPEPTSPLLTSGLFSLAAIAAALPGVDAAVVLGAFSGAVVFIMASNEMSALAKAGYFIPAFITGLLGATPVAKGIGALVPAALQVGPGVGALVAATITVKLLIWLLGQTPASLLQMWKDFRRDTPK